MSTPPPRFFSLQCALALGFCSASEALFADANSLLAENAQFAKPLTILTLGVLLAYFILVRPERLKRHTLQQQQEGIGRGDEVLATVVKGKVARVEEQSVFIQLGDGAHLEIPKFAILEVHPASAAKKKTPAK